MTVTAVPVMRTASLANAASSTTIPPPSAPARLQPTVTIASAPIGRIERGPSRYAASSDTVKRTVSVRFPAP